MPFDSPDLNLGEMLGDVDSGKVQLPDFQREWKWDTDMIASLLTSISLGHPLGVVMMLETGGEDVQFLPRPLSGVQLAKPVPPQQLILDGQQRLTSLYQALKASAPVETKDSRGKQFKRWYYLDIRKCLDPQEDREEAVLSVPADRMVRNFRNEPLADYSTLTAECEAEVFPLHRTFDPGAIFEWFGAFMATDSGRAAVWNQFYEEVLKNFIGYTVPVIVLKKETPREAVCTVFEKVNTGGVPLNVFELLTATFAAVSGEFKLNQDWKDRRERLYQLPVLRSVESTDFLQAITLLTTHQ